MGDDGPATAARLMATIRTAASLLFLAALPPGRAHAQIDSLALREHARILAHDSLRGRDTGSAGERAAAAYIATQLERIGLDPVAPAGFRVALPLLRPTLGQESTIRVIRGTDTTVFRPGTDFVPGRMGRGSLHDFAGPVVYVAAGAAVAPKELAGKVVLSTEPPAEDTRQRIRAWIEAGVRAVLLPVPDTAALASVRSQAGERLVVDADVDDPVWQPDLPVLWTGPTMTRALIAGASPVPGSAGIDLGRSVEADLDWRTEPIASANVAGIVAGSDPALRDEVVLLTAHYDHLGIGPPVNGDSIYNGFSDNAAGVAMLLEIAAALKADPPARSVAFLFTSGEERGLLGATAWAADPPIPLHRTRAVINLDAGAPPAPPVRWRVAGDTAGLAVRSAAEVVESSGWTADRTTASANSDHWPFMDRGVPTVFLVPGREWEGRDEAARDRLFRQWDRYHQPDDEWRTGYPLAGLTRYAELALRIARRLAGRDGTARP